MTHSRHDCPAFEPSGGAQIPCAAQAITIALMGEAAKFIDKQLIDHAAAAVLHYFKNDLGQQTISLKEFAAVLEKVLNGFGLSVAAAHVEMPVPPVSEADLRQLACESGKGFELAFFPRLRDVVRRNLDSGPRILCFRGLRGCVKQLMGARRWSGRCQALNDQIVEHLRSCLTCERTGDRCALVVV